MADSRYKPEWQKSIIALSNMAMVVMIVGVMYWARAIVIPLAFAVFFTFVLTPLVNALQRRRLGPNTSVVITVLISALFLFTALYVVGRQISELTRTLPDHEHTIRGKIEQIKSWTSGGDSRLSNFLDDLQRLIASDIPAPSQQQRAERNESPIPVVVEPQGPTWTNRLETIIGPLAETAGQIAFTLVLVVYMLMKRHDLRNRLLRLIGVERVATTTKAVDDASRRVSRYLLVQLLLNTSFGVVICFGLFTIGIEYALLWGFIAALMRYIPYIGTWVGIIPTAIFVFATTEGMWQSAVTVGLFFTLEVLYNNFFEPHFYGTSLGMSEVAQLAAAGFWSFLWGPIGLILSGPITTCLLVVGKYAPQFQIFDLILGDEPPFEPGVLLFQRLAARDQDEAYRIVHSRLKDSDITTVCDEVLIPALRLTRIAFDDGSLDDHDRKYIQTTIHETVADLIDLSQSDERKDSNDESLIGIRLLICSARDAFDEIGVEMFLNSLDHNRWQFQVTTSSSLTSETVEQVGVRQVVVVCIVSTTPGGLAQTRHLCKRLRTRYSNLMILISRWGAQEINEGERLELAQAGADQICWNLRSSIDQLQNWAELLRSKQEQERIASAKKEVKELVGTVSAS